METLPPEVMFKIGGYLPVEDLASCCSVSVWWREVFGSDEVWKPRCDPDAEEYLRTTPCRVEPKFTSPESENSTLSPVGRWRTAYMREKHVLKNWMHGNCVEYKINIFCEKIFFLNNDFIITVSEDLIALVDTTKEPPVCVAELTNTAISCEVSVVRSDTFIVWDKNNTVQVVQVNWEPHALKVKHTFGVSEGESICQYDIVGTVFVGLDSYKLHIWDLEKATKLKTEFCPDGFQFFEVGHDKKCENVGVTIASTRINSNRSDFLLYNVKQLKFWPFAIRCAERMWTFAIIDHYVILGSDRWVKVFNYKPSACYQELYTESVTFSNVFVVEDSFMFTTKNKELVQIYPSSGVVKCLNTNVLIKWRVVGTLYMVYLLEEKKVELWKITPKSTVKLTRWSLWYPGSIAVNQAHSKVGIVPLDNISIVDWDEPDKPAVVRSYW